MTSTRLFLAACGVGLLVVVGCTAYGPGWWCHPLVALCGACVVGQWVMVIRGK